MNENSQSRGLFDLTGRVAIVTGTSRGLGTVLAALSPRAGADLVLTSRERDSLAPFEARSKPRPPRRSFDLDVRDQHSIERMALPQKKPSAISTFW